MKTIIEQLEKRIDELDEKTELLIIYKKDSDMSVPITNMIKNSGITGKIVNREIIIDSVGEYNMIYSMDTNIQSIINLLSRDLYGLSIEELMDNQKDPKIKNKPSIERFSFTR